LQLHLPITKTIAAHQRRDRQQLRGKAIAKAKFKPIIDKILAEGGFAAGPDALTTLTNALAAQQLAGPAELPAVIDTDDDEVAIPPATISGPGKATLGPKT
jgi:flotillin